MGECLFSLDNVLLTKEKYETFVKENAIEVDPIENLLKDKINKIDEISKKKKRVARKTKLREKVCI
ncbi:unnamed protein product [Meloidogyne enterolobii]|uniref:Uncharacterized protein n=1 Tax=Meloidogyne enterolobii TaxID=390850 RepID=A0ACB1AZ35_MELEN